MDDKARIWKKRYFNLLKEYEKLLLVQDKKREEDILLLEEISKALEISELNFFNTEGVTIQ